ncbi:hypothetical protein GPECTOR_15g445 [Gonium pectorale]|uniref:HNH nuclease domain-containing protein n=1 Tax=Gonium pectorale TaxID=33097 RepID=A0A150GN37_GONPE|nr:hypothetical protein GPECTOR_15g445 [Gonium pectorale]|eukprot:KXZ50760.1 hypothetical protein GPECTOR_15g445 [Gonium pectorale]
MSFRKGVTHKEDKVWRNNNNKDLYTRWNRNKFDSERVDTQVDHIVECQLGEYMWENAFDGRRTTRGRLAPVVQLWNDVDNLNNTSTGLNQRKGDAFEMWKDGREPSLWSALVRYNVPANHRANICVAFEDTADWLAGELDDMADEMECDLYGNMASELDNWREKTGN